MGVKKSHLNRKGNSVFAKISLIFNYEGNLSIEENCVFNDSTFWQSDVKKALKDIRTSNSNKLTFGHLNINSSRNKFALLSAQVKGSIDSYGVWNEIGW